MSRFEILNKHFGIDANNIKVENVRDDKDCYFDTRNLVELLKKYHSHFHFLEDAKEILVSQGFKDVTIRNKVSNNDSNYFMCNGEELVAVKRGKTRKCIMLMIDILPSCFYANGLHEYKRDGLVLCDVKSKVPDSQLRSWYDRNLKAAGKVFYNENGEIKSKNFVTKDAVAIIPTLAIHFTRSLKAYGPSSAGMRPMFSTEGACAGSSDPCSALLECIANASGITSSAIVDLKTFFIDANEPALMGIDSSMISGCGVGISSTALIALNEFLLCNNSDITILLSMGSKRNSELISIITSDLGDLLPDIIKVEEKQCSDLSQKVSVSHGASLFGSTIKNLASKEHVHCSSIPLSNIDCVTLSLPVVGKDSSRTYISASELQALSKILSVVFDDYK